MGRAAGSVVVLIGFVPTPGRSSTASLPIKPPPHTPAQRPVLNHTTSKTSKANQQNRNRHMGRPRNDPPSPLIDAALPRRARGSVLIRVQCILAPSGPPKHHPNPQRKSTRVFLPQTRPSLSTTGALWWWWWSSAGCNRPVEKALRRALAVVQLVHIGELCLLL